MVITVQKLRGNGLMPDFSGDDGGFFINNFDVFNLCTAKERKIVMLQTVICQRLNPEKDSQIYNSYFFVGMSILNVTKVTYFLSKNIRNSCLHV
jgi:hypothetical protein